MKFILVIPFMILSALLLFGVGVFLAWVFMGIYVSDALFLRAFFGAIAGFFGLIFLAMIIEEDLIR